VRESHEETRRKVIASEAKQSAVFLFASTKTRESKQAAAPPYCDSKFPAIRITGARSDGSVICHCERSEAICSFSFCFYPRQENKGKRSTALATPSLEGGRGVRELQKGCMGAVIASEAKQSAVYLFASTKTRE
jgi:hypothetical protein